jgi:hypothetical protein
MTKLSDNRYLADLFTKDSVQANFLREITRAIDTLASGTGVGISGDPTPPPPVNAITVKTSGELVQVQLTHSGNFRRPVRYFVEADTSPSFTQPQIVSYGPHRTHLFHLPTLNDEGAAQRWYLRAYPQYLGSQPGESTVYGGLANPTPVQLVGTTAMTLLPSTGSGTASTNGQQGAQGFGKQRNSTPKVQRVGKSVASSTPVAPLASNAAIHLLGAITSAAQTTSVTQSGTSTAIVVNGGAGVAGGTFWLGDLTISCYGATIDPGAYGTWYIYHDDPNLQGGPVQYQFTNSIIVLAQGFGRFYDGKITTTSGGGGSGGGTGGGGGGGGRGGGNLQ